MSTNLKFESIGGSAPALIHPECNKTDKSDQRLSSNQSDKNIKNGKGFLFDVAVVRLDVPSKTIEESSQLMVNVNFNDRNISITPSCMNILDFMPERSLGFVANPLELKQQLTKNPLNVKVADTDVVIGYGSMAWPKEFLEDLVRCSGEVMNSFEIELMKCDGTRTGVIQLIVRLQPKCEEYLEDGNCFHANDDINPNDVRFLIEEEKSNCSCSQIGVIPASDSDHDLQPKCLDLSNFLAINNQHSNNTDILACLDAAGKTIKPISNHYQKLIDEAKSKRRENANISDFQTEKDALFCTVSSDCFLRSQLIPTSSGRDSCELPAVVQSDNEPFAAKMQQMQVINKEDAPELLINEPLSFKCCPLCKENMKYLPKLAACPNCCYKPVPYFHEKPYNISQSADEILKESYMLQKSTTSDLCTDRNSKAQPESRCTCAYRQKQTCAYCRSQKACEHLYRPSPPMTKPADDCEPKSSDIHCISSSENRPYLTRILSELKVIYDIEEPTKKPFQLQDRDENERNKKPAMKMPFAPRKKSKAEPQKKETVAVSQSVKCRKGRKRVLRPASELVPKSRLYDYELVPRNVSSGIGHKTCVNGFAGRKNVPPNMGWLWNIHNSRKWKPGAIRKPVKELMGYFLSDFPADTLLVSRYSYRNRCKSNGANQPQLNRLVQKPTLRIHKKDGQFLITMRPLRPREVLKDAADPYENMKPIQFRIVKNPLLETQRNLKKYLKSLGFRKCTCHSPIAYCYCRTFVDKKELEYQCNKECSKLNIKPCCDTLVLSDTSESEAEFDFDLTPPVGLIKPERLKTVNLVNVGTQYDELDWNRPPLFQRTPNKYMRMYQCAVQDRNAKATRAEKAHTRLGTGAKAADRVLARKRSARRLADMGNTGAKGYESVFVGAKGGGDGVLTHRAAVRGGKKGAANDFIEKSFTNSVSNKKEEKAKIATKRRVNMLKYVMKMNKKMSKIAPVDAAAKRREKMSLLKGVNPPILCMIERRGKPVDPCAPCFPNNNIPIC